MRQDAIKKAFDQSVDEELYWLLNSRSAAAEMSGKDWPVNMRTGPSRTFESTCG